MDLGKIFAGIATVAIAIPFVLTSLQRGYINLNGLVLVFSEIVTEVITRQPANWQPPTEPAPLPQQPPESQSGGAL
ncbi:hypothetical protein [Thermoleptolyngbya sp. M55_K2018_002]|uniref:hypothetical protein n=1 Tax=Thermoleptolyngbya sp. M55_K2018_002 TaxID=2747808 RepID=UPI001A016983|nr:hypothetical protein [Thermoleptolyngbya sp. M55_K2018_002]HIK39778.1 hypothetical protein [Thermoleptolyngbya sp. M55_K2018_002]